MLQNKNQNFSPLVLFMLFTLTKLSNIQQFSILGKKNSERSGTILLKKLKILKFVVRINNPFVPLTIANYSGRIFSRTSTNLFFDSSVQF